MEQPKEYYAFISYKREDEKWAKWLQDKLEHYKFPTNLNGRADLPKKIYPTFRDVTDLNPGVLAEEIDKALHNSQWLIVVCSPRSAKSPWVCKEAQSFIDLGRADHIIPFVIEGVPFSKDPATECYPEALLNLTDSKELLAANINEMGRDAAAIKVVARMFNLRFDTLWQRHEREQRRKRWMWIGGSILIALLGFSIAGYFVRQNGIIESQKERLQQDSITMADHLLQISAQNDSISSQNNLIISQRDSIEHSMQQLQLTNRLLAEERDHVLMANRGMMINRAHFISQEAMQLIKEGDTYRAIALILEVMPSSEYPERPYVGEAEKVLRAALDSLERNGYVPIAILDCQYDKATYYECVQDLMYDKKTHLLWVQFHISDDSGNIINCYNINNGGLMHSFIEYESDKYDEIEKRCGFKSFNSDNLVLGQEFLYDNNKYKVCVSERNVLLYKKHIASQKEIYYDLPLGPEWGLDKSAFSNNGNYMIIRDSIYNFLTGSSVRSIGLPKHNDIIGKYSPDGQFIIVKNDEAFSVEDAISGKILSTLDCGDLFTDVEFLDFEIINSALCINNGLDNNDCCILSLPDLKKIYHGRDSKDYFGYDDYMFDYDRNKHLLTIRKGAQGPILKRVKIDLSFMENNYDSYSFEFLEKNILYIGGIVGQMIIYDIDKNVIIRKTQHAPDRYEGSFFNANKTNYVTFTMDGDIKIYDAVFGELMYSFVPSDSWGDGKISALHGYECSFSKDEKYIIYMCENSNLEDGSWSVVVIKWDGLSNIIKTANSVISGRLLSNEEKRMFYLE